MRRLRFRVGIRICDAIGGPIDALILRVPWLAERTGACLILHGIVVPEAWTR